jgi:UDP-N-acetylmuramate: L-alanyl-gamma-D-glutamyl-meso-diaminopimelate ligase
MGSLAGLLKARGFQVRGSDADPRPPISSMLEQLGISVLKGYSPANLDPHPDVVVVGNVVGRNNPEVAALLQSGIPYLSMPQAIGEYLLTGRHPVVVVGTHGKTTTAAMMSHVLDESGQDPSFLVGGVIQGGERSFRLGNGSHIVVEGDEYETSFFDKGPKFLHYRPRTAILTSIEFDHGEMYDSIEAIEKAFTRFVSLLKEDCTLVACADDPRVEKILSGAGLPRIIRYGLSGGDLRGRVLESEPTGTRFEVASHDERIGQTGKPSTFRFPLSGNHNVLNALGVIGAARSLGLTDAEIARGLDSFPGVHRRQEVVGTVSGVTVLDDFAHHPSAVKATIQAIKSRYAGSRLWAIFEPRTNTSRTNRFQEEYGMAFDDADMTLIAPVHLPEKAPEGRRLDVARIVSDLRSRGVNARNLNSIDAIVKTVASEAKPGDVLLVMSNGTFGGIHQKLLAALGQSDKAEKAAQ